MELKIYLSLSCCLLVDSSIIHLAVFYFAVAGRNDGILEQQGILRKDRMETERTEEPVCTSDRSQAYK